MDRAIDWYTGQLGFQLSSREGDRMAFLHLPEGPYLMLWQTEDESTYAHYTVNGVDFPVLMYRTTRIHELHDLLCRSNTRIQVYQDDGFGWVLKFYDCEGNLWGALQFHSASDEQQTQE